jgi:hypothetical protein
MENADRGYVITREAKVIPVANTYPIKSNTKTETRLSRCEENTGTITERICPFVPVVTILEERSGMWAKRTHRRILPATRMNLLRSIISIFIPKLCLYHHLHHCKKNSSKRKWYKVRSKLNDEQPPYSPN